MDTSVAASVDDIRDGGSDAMMVTTDKDDFFLGVDGESRELCFSWAADNESRTIIVGDGNCAVLPSPPLMNGDTTTKTQEDLSRGRVGSVEQISRPKNTKPQTRVYNLKDLISPSRLTEALSHPSNNDRGSVRMDTDMVPPHQDDPEVIRAVPEAQAPERKKRIRWTDDEHKLLLMGVMIFEDKWRKIRKHFVGTKSSTQFGSHVQKFNERKNQMNRKRHTINDIDITREDVVRLAPKEWRLAVLSAMAARSNGEKTLVQQYPNAAMQENASGCSAPARRRPFFIPSVQETVMNPSALIEQPASSIAFASSNVGLTPLRPASSFVAEAHGRQTPLVQPSPCPHLRAAYLGYPSSTYYPANYQPLSLPQLDKTPSPGTYYSTLMRRSSYTGLAPTPALPRPRDCPNPWKNP